MRIQQSAAVLFLAVPLFAQQAAAPAASSSDPQSSQSEYGGPAILTRGGTSSLHVPTESIRLRPFVDITGTYDAGITPVSVDSAGKIPDEVSTGVSVDMGLLGYRRFRQASVTLDYRGAYRHYTHSNYYDSTDQSLSLIYKRQATRRLGFALREQAGIFSRGNLTGQDSRLIDPNFANVPHQEILDGRTMYLSTMADLTFSKTSRLTFNLGGDGFLVRRRSSSLYGVTGYRARGDAAYRTSRFATTSAAYDFTHYEYTKGFGASDIHTASVGQSFRLGRPWEVALRAGGSRVETLGLTGVTVDPIIAAITGQSRGVEVIYRINWVPSLAASITHEFRHSTFSVAYFRGVSPGNGVFLTSRSESTSAAYSYNGIRKWNFGLSGGHDTLGSLTAAVGNYSSNFAGAGATYTLTGALHFISRFDIRRFDVGNTSFQRDNVRVAIGFGFSPGDLPLSLW